MSEPLIFITKHTVKEGRVRDLEHVTDEFLKFVHANEPRVLAVAAYLTDKRDQLSLVQIHPDPESLDFHLQVAGDKIHAALNVVDNDSVELYGTPGPTTRSLLDQIASAGVTVVEYPAPVGGFDRLGAA